MMAVVGAEDELVAVYDAAGRVTGTESRGVVYRDGIWHGGTGVLVRSVDGERVVVHRRTPDKLIFPSLWDCWAGGVISPGEDPAEGAARELAEELGVTGVPLVAADRFAFDDGRLRYHVFTYEVRYDGPLTPQATEVAWAGRITLDELRGRLADPQRWPFVPDGRQAIERWFERESRRVQLQRRAPVSGVAGDQVRRERS